MYARILLLFVIMSLFVACDEEPSSTNSATLLIGANDSARMAKPDAPTPDSAVVAWDGFTEIYEYRDSNDFLRLGIRHLNNRTIAFHLFEESPLCVVHVSDTAILKDMGEPAIDKDEKGNSYLADEFLMENSHFSLSLRPSKEKSRARFIYNTKEQTFATDCFPVDSYLLKRKK